MATTHCKRRIAVDPKSATPATPASVAKETAALLRKLKGMKDRSSLEARSIRRALRAIGHKGGLRAQDGGA
jgi:hypothetical protein